MVTSNQFRAIKEMSVSVSKCVTFQNTAKKHNTSSGKCHRFIPSVPQIFDCRVKASIKPELKYTDLKIKNEEFKTEYSHEYPRKIKLGESYYKSPGHESFKYLRPVGEKLIAEPVRPIPYPISEMKDSFELKYVIPSEEPIRPPTETAKCYVNAPGREQQPPIKATRRGFWRWTDPYLTANRSDYSGQDPNDKINVETLTFYNEATFDLPSASGNRTMFDRAIFKHVLPIRLQSRAQQRIPNSGMESEYQDHFVSQSFSHCYPYLHNSGAEFDDPIPLASSWQALAPPGMYCSEYCTIGRGSVRQTIDQTATTKDIKRTPNCRSCY